MDPSDHVIEEREQYFMMVNQIFQCEEQGYEHYNRYAKAKGFSVRLDDKEFVPRTKEVRRISFCCSKEGYRLQKYFEATDQKREPRALTRCGCKAMLEIQRIDGTGEWFVKKIVDDHPHSLADPEQVVFLRSHRRISDTQKADAVEYGIGGLRTCEIMDVVVTASGGFDKVGFASRDLYNFFARYKKKRILGRDAEFVLNHMRVQGYAKKASAALFKAAKSTERSQQVLDLLQTILDEPVKNDENTDETTFGPIPSHYSASSRASRDRVLDPKVIVPKGAPCKKRMKPFHETLRESNGRKKRSRRCRECGDLNHDIRKCPTLGR